MHISSLRLAVVALVLPIVLVAQRPRAGDYPNVVLIITDDVGYGDFGVYGAPDVKTPNIDRLARQGVRFTDFYAAPQCTPTRAALITGRYQQRVKLERALATVGPALEEGLPVSGRSLPELVRLGGYSTGLVGKWHLGFKPEFSPNAHGFEYFYGFLAGYIDFYTHTRAPDGKLDLQENGTPASDSGYMTDLITSHAIRFIDDHAAKPFFLEVTYNAAHWPFQRPDHYSVAANHGAFQGPDDSIPATRADYVAMIERADQGVGKIVAALERNGLGSNTLVIFTNDNGGEWLSRNAPLFHRKDTLWEGGIRVPAIFRWPGTLPAGKTTALPGITMDLTATILAVTHADIPNDAKLEGVNLIPVLTGKAAPPDRALFWRIAVPTRQQRAVRKGDWKLLLDGDDLMLFNLKTDLGERRDLAAKNPAMVRQLRALLTGWEKDVDAEAAARAK